MFIKNLNKKIYFYIFILTFTSCINGVCIKYPRWSIIRVGAPSARRSQKRTSGRPAHHCTNIGFPVPEHNIVSEAVVSKQEGTLPD